MGYPVRILVGYVLVGAGGLWLTVSHKETVTVDSWVLWSATWAFLLVGARAGWHASAMGSPDSQRSESSAQGGDLAVAAVAAIAVLYFKDRLPEGGTLWLGGVALTAMAVTFWLGAAYRWHSSSEERPQ
jgi:hypothetical protein